ncbi:MAG: hypothetical protein FJ225_08745 [Lentisphaerae bacterium]|nr:hypothetical protein [Lentisphaerota bacterium]
MIEIMAGYAGVSTDAMLKLLKSAALLLVLWTVRFLRKLTPIVYTSVRDSGVLLTIRYIVKPRERRGSENDIWEAILIEFVRHPDISLAVSRNAAPPGGGGAAWRARG